MKSKQELKKVFENGDKPKQEDFWEWQDSYWHKEEMIPKEKIEGLELNSVDFNMQWSSTEKKLSLLDSLGNKISEISLQSLDNEGIDLRYNASTLSLELYNADNELLDSIPITDFVKNVGTQLSLNSNTLQLKDSVGNVLSTVSFAVNNIQNLQTVLDGKLDRGTYTGTAQDIYDRFEGKIVADTNNIPRVGNGASGKVLDNSIMYQYNGKLGVGTSGEPSEKLDVNGNLKADNLKAKSAQFQLQTSIVATPNTLVPKTDGSGLLWYNNSSVGSVLPCFPLDFAYLYGAGNNSSNTVYGHRAFSNNTTGAYNIAIGEDALSRNTSGMLNISMGGLASNTTGSDNVVIGIESMNYSNTTGSANTVVGRYAGMSTNSNDKVLIGYGAGNSGGAGLIAIGKGSGNGNTGVDNIAIGKGAGSSVTGSANTVVGGGSAGLGITTGVWNVAVGTEAMTGANNGSSENVALGFDAMTVWTRGSGVTNSNYNVTLGSRAGSHGYLGDYNTILGHNAIWTNPDISHTSKINKRIIIGASISKVGSSIDDYPISVNMEAAVPYGKHNYKNLPLRFQLPNMTKTQRNALTSPTVGEMIWQTDNGNSGIRVFDGTNWLALQSTID